MVNTWLISIVIVILIWLCLELRALSKAMSKMPHFGFAQPNEWVSMLDIGGIRTILIRWANKNEIDDSDLDIIAKFLGIHAMKWEIEKAGREMSLREVNRWDHINPIPPKSFEEDQ